MAKPTDRDREMAHRWANNQMGQTNVLSLIELIAAAREEGRRELRPITESMITGAYETLRARLVMTMRSLPEAAGRHLAYEVLRAAEKARREFPNG